MQHEKYKKYTQTQGTNIKEGKKWSLMITWHYL